MQKKWKMTKINFEKRKTERDRQIAELMAEGERNGRKLSETREMNAKCLVKRVSINYGIHVDVRFD